MSDACVSTEMCSLQYAFHYNHVSDGNAQMYSYSVLHSFFLIFVRDIVYLQFPSPVVEHLLA